MSDGVAQARHPLKAVLVMAPAAHGTARLTVSPVSPADVVGIGVRLASLMGLTKTVGAPYGSPKT